MASIILKKALGTKFNFLKGTKKIIFAKIVNPFAFPTNGLRAFWKFEGNLNDSSGNGFHLTQNNGTAAFTTGKVGQCFNYLGDPTYINSSCYLTQSNVHFAGSMTFSMWHKFISPYIHNRYGDRGNSLVQLYNTFGMGTDPYDSTKVNITNLATWGVTTPTNTIQIGQWYHYLATMDSTTSTSKLYINGNLFITTTNSLSFASTVRPLGFGGDTTDINTNTPTPAHIDAVGVWTRVLTNQEILNLYNNGNGLEP